MSGDWRVCVIGLGAVGMPTAEYIASKGIYVYGYDIVPKKIDKFPVTTNWEEIPHSKINVYLVAVWVDLDGNSLHDVCGRVSKVNSKALVAIESTVPVGTCRKFSEIYSLHRLVHVPHRYWKGDPVNYGVRQLRVFGALNSESKEIGLKFYKSIGIPLHVVDPIEIAEMCKIAENSYRFVQIAFAEELKMICDRLKLNFEEVRKACNTKWNVEILEARRGIGGECLPKDIKFLIHHAGRAPILEAAVKSDEEYRKLVK